MNTINYQARLAVAVFFILAIQAATAAPRTWTLNNVTTTGGVSWTGTFDYDAATNTYSSINIVTTLSGAPNPWNTVSTDSFLTLGCTDPATASGVIVGFNAEGVTIFCMDFVSPLTDAGGSIDLVTGQRGWATLLTGGDIISGSVSSPVTWTLNNVTTTGGVSWTGTFDYDAETNAYSSINIVTTLAGAPNPWNTLSTDSGLGVGCTDPATASGLTIGFNAAGITIFCMDFSTPLTNAGGTINLLTGDIGWATLGTSGDITGGSVSAFAPIAADVDIKPGSSSNVVHPHHDGSASAIAGLNDIIPVVVLSSSLGVGDPVNLDATTIDPATVKFGPLQGAIAPASIPTFDVDYDSDGMDDAQFEFLTSDAGLACTDTEASISGETTAGEAFSGADTITANCDALCHD